MPATVIDDERPAHALDTTARPGARRLSAAELAAVTGREKQTEGPCRGQTCVPLPHDGSPEDADGQPEWLDG
jgi:hypothetical protein